MKEINKILAKSPSQWPVSNSIGNIEYFAIEMGKNCLFHACIKVSVSGRFHKEVHFNAVTSSSNSSVVRPIYSSGLVT